MIHTDLPEVSFWHGDVPVCTLRCVPPAEGELVVLKYEERPMTWWRVEHRRMEIVRVLGEPYLTITSRWVVVIRPAVDTSVYRKRGGE